MVHCRKHGALQKTWCIAEMMVHCRNDGALQKTGSVGLKKSVVEKTACLR